jgi:cytochrome b561
MQEISTHTTRYDRATMAFHWATAILVTFQWLGAQTIDWFPRGALRVDARSVHITAGVLLAAVIVARLVWRATRGRRLPRADKGLLGVIAKGTHLAFYALLLAMVGVGMVLTWTRGDSIFNLFSIPAFDPADRSLAHRVQDIHATIGWIIVALAGLHASAALVHRFVWRDGVLARMLPSRTS